MNDKAFLRLRHLYAQIIQKKSISNTLGKDWSVGMNLQVNKNERLYYFKWILQKLQHDAL